MLWLGFSGALTTPVWAGAWVQKAGKSYVETRFQLGWADRERNHEGRSVSIFEDRVNFIEADYREVSTQVYVEHGLGQQVSLVGQLNGKYAEARRTELGGAYFDRVRVKTISIGPADLWFGARIGVLGPPWVASVEGLVKAPLGYSSEPADGGPPLGNAEWDGDLKIYLGRSFGGYHVSAATGYRVRGGEYHDAFLYELEGGAQSGPWRFLARMDGLASTVAPRDIAGAPVVTPSPGGGGTFEVIVGDQEWTKLSTALSRRVGSLWLKVSVADLVAGRNTVETTEIGIGVFIER